MNRHYDIAIIGSGPAGLSAALYVKRAGLTCAVIGKDGAEPVAIDKVDNRHIIGLMRVVKAYEKYTVEAATTGSEAAAINALLVHPLVGDWEKAHKCFEEMKWAHKAYLPEFFPNDVVIKC